MQYINDNYAIYMRITIYIYIYIRISPAVIVNSFSVSDDFVNIYKCERSIMRLSNIFYIYFHLPTFYPFNVKN